MQIHAYMRTHLLFRLHQTAKGCCENNGICLKKHSALCKMSLDMETDNNHLWSEEKNSYATFYKQL